MHLPPIPIRVEDWFGNSSHSQSILELVNGSDTIGTVIVEDGGVLLGGVVAEQEHLLAIEGVFGPSDVR